MTKKLLFVVIAVICLFNSCSKYEDGPAISLLSKKARITGTWTMESIVENGVTVDLGFLSVFAGTLTYDKNGDYYSSWDTDYKSNWELKDAETILVTDPDGEKYEQHILKLKNKEMWVEYEETDEDGKKSVTEIHLKQ